MNRKGLACTGLLITTLGLCVPTLPRASGQGAPEAQRVSLDIGGVEVWLGMPQKIASSEFAKGGYDLIPPGDSSLVLRGAGNDVKEFGQVVFRNGRLVYASRDWPGGEKSIESVFAILTSFAQKGSNLCVLSTEPLREPRFQMERLWVSCGKRTLFLKELTVPEKSWTVEEWIGQPPQKGERP